MNYYTLLISSLWIAAVNAFYMKPTNIMRSRVYSKTMVDFCEEPIKKPPKSFTPLNRDLSATLPINDCPISNLHQCKILLYELESSSTDVSFPKNDEYVRTKEDNLYTLIWYDCKECDALLEEVYKTKLQFIYIDGSYYFYDRDSPDNKPLLYRDETFIADDLFEIYSELFAT